MHLRTTLQADRYILVAWLRKIVPLADIEAFDIFTGCSHCDIRRAIARARLHTRLKCLRRAINSTPKFA